MVTFFDHDSPNFVMDGVMVTTTGAQATPDPEHHRTDFPAYWDPALRQYLDYDGHNGYDYDLSYQPVYAAAPGKVIFAAYEYPDAPDHGYGKMIMIDHHNGYVTLYGHFSRIMVKVGQKVRRGQQIGVSGNTGHSTGPHLHFTVFHNCSPTDPYGWAGSGPDPLSSYQGEVSIPLWIDQPFITNPQPGWPGMSELPGATAERRLLLELPSTRGGTSTFERTLRSRVHAALSALARDHLNGRADMLRGAVDTTAAVAPSTLYRIPFVVSIESLDSVDGSRPEVIAALARADLAGRHPVQHLSGSSSWTGYLIHWAGRTLLVGTGTKGREVALNLPDSPHKTRVRASSRDGTYAVDLGHLSSGQYTQLAKQLRSSERKSSTVKVASAPPVAAKPAGRQAPAQSSAGSMDWLALPVLLCMGALAGGVHWRARRV